MATRTRNGRVQIDRAGITALTGAAASTIAYWQRHRHQTSFPRKADTDAAGRDWFWRDEVDAFWRTHQQRRARSYTDVDRRGHPGDLLTAPEAAKVLGYKDHRSLTPTLRNDPDQVERLPSGLLRRYWHRRTIWNYADSRPLRTSTGHPTGAVGARKPHPYANDPRLHTAMALLAQAEATARDVHRLGAVLAEHLHIGIRTAQRLLAAARGGYQPGPLGVAGEHEADPDR
jgi:hypothetical protein